MLLRGNSLIALCDIAPVDNLPNGFHIVGPHVFILQVVGVLPDIDALEEAQALSC